MKTVRFQDEWMTPLLNSLRGAPDGAIQLGKVGRREGYWNELGANLRDGANLRELARELAGRP